MVTHVTPRLPLWKDAIDEMIASRLLWQRRAVINAAPGGDHKGDREEGAVKGRRNEYYRTRRVSAKTSIFVQSTIMY